jgi:DNA replication and repair protein RecF
MFLKKLSLINYKNLPELEVEFCSGINCFIGQNGVGKTNLLDTVYYLAFCKSHTNNIDSQNIRHNEGFMMLSGHFLRNNIEENISVGVKKDKSRDFNATKRNQKT